jgi:tRNA threonylcarbamoyladenosine modification (KEOPS) complex  Pcc1 subunit
MVSKTELKNELLRIGIKVQGNFAKKKDIVKALEVLAAPNKYKNFRLVRQYLPVFSKKLEIRPKDVNMLNTFLDSFLRDIETVEKNLEKVKAALETKDAKDLLLENYGYSAADLNKFKGAIDSILGKKKNLQE